MIINVKDSDKIILPTTADYKDTLKKFEGDYDADKINYKPVYKTHQTGYDYMMAKRRKLSKHS